MNAYETLNLPRTATREEIRKAYRELARRWHPDRFPDGPERDWANEHMAAINAAYRECLDKISFKALRPQEETAAYDEIERLVREEALDEALKRLSAFTTRSARWNYLFGIIQQKKRRYAHASRYLSVAYHQDPKNAEYDRAYREITDLLRQRSLITMMKKLRANEKRESV